MEASELIKRFREGKPMPREERESQLRSRGKDRMWWEDSETSNKSQPRSTVTPTTEEVSLNRSGKLRVNTAGADPLEEVVRESRRSTSASRTREPNKDFPEHELLRPYEPLRESSPYRTRALGRSLDVDSLIESEIRQLQRDLQQKERDTVNRFNLGSFTPNSRVLDRGVTSRETSRSPNRLRGSRSGEFTFGKAADRLAMSGEVLRGSVDTLGSTGFLGLLKADLKLDGRKEEEEKKDDSVVVGGNVADLNAGLEELLKALKKGAPEKSSYLPEGIEETIPQITAKLHQDMLEFSTLYENAIKQEETITKEIKEREEKLRQEGRDEERATKFLQLEPPIMDPLGYLDLWMEQPVQGNKVINIPANLQKVGEQKVDVDKPKVSKVHDAALVMQKVIDNELYSAEETFHQMRHLRTKMGVRMRQLHAVQSSTPYAGNAALDEAMKRRGVLNDNFSSAPGNGGGYYAAGTRHWGLEDLEPEDDHEDIRKTFNPYPELVHENIFQIAKAVESSLTVAMDTLEKRLTRYEKTEEPPAVVVPLLTVPEVAPVLPPVETQPAKVPDPVPSKAKPSEVVSSNEWELSASFESAKSPFRHMPHHIPPNYSKEQQQQDLDSIDSVLGKSVDGNQRVRYLSSDPLRDIRREKVVFAPQNEKIRTYNQQYNYAPAAPSQYAPSAPPAMMDYSFAQPPASTNQSLNASNSSFPPAYAPPSSSSAYNQSLNYQSNMNIPRRPLEGMAINYLKSQPLQPEAPVAAHNPNYHRQQSYQQQPPQPNIVQNTQYQQYPQPPVTNTASNSINLPSQSASMSERELYLQKMRGLRENIASVVCM